MSNKESLGFSLQELADALGATVHGEPEQGITGLASIENAGQGQLAFIASKKYLKALEACQASAILLNQDLLEYSKGNALVVDNPELAFAKLTDIFNDRPKAAPGVHASAVVDQSATLGEGVSIAANAIIEQNVRLGDGVNVGAGCVVRQSSVIGAGTILYPNVTIYHNVSVGSECIVHSGTVLGSDGFGYVAGQSGMVKLHQLGSLVIGDKVEFGANCTIDRGALSDTVIADGVKMDNQVHIAHNVEIGKNTAIAGCVGIAGSAKIGENCQFGGMVGIVGHIEIVDNVIVTGMAMVTKSITEAGLYSGNIPAMENRLWRRNVAQFKKLNDLAKRLKQGKAD